jgi:hypothetical protein
MTLRLRIATLAGVTLLALALTTATARADGLPVPGVFTDPDGVAAVGGGHHFTSYRSHGATVVERFDRPGHTVASRTLHGRWTVPAVAVDGTAGGLSADARTLALIRPRKSFHQSQTHLALLATTHLRIVDRISLRGDFSFDAISPDGSRLYLIEYLDRRDPTDYAVRALDTSTGRLEPKPIVDPDEPVDEMRGIPLTRTMSADGRWAYTLYDGNGKHPFVHALDTERGRAVCIDLDHDLLAGVRQLWRVKLAVDRPRQLSLLDRGGPVALIDTTTFEVSGASAGRGDSGDGDGGSGTPWALLAAAALTIVAAAWIAASLVRRRRRLAAGSTA